MVSQFPADDMVIKPGNIAGAIPGLPTTTVSDGKRMRVLWTDGDGNGDPNINYIARSKTTVRGHPTWKLYAGDIPRPIHRGRREPPRFVYLDDRACYAIYSSHAYGEKDLSTFWPYDFDFLGNIKASRPNRGRPAYADSSYTVFAKGSLRGGKPAEYEFCGGPASPKQHTPDWRTKKAAERAEAKKVEAGTQISLSGAIPVFPARPIWKQEPLGSTSTKSKYESLTPKPYVSGPVDGNLKPLGITDRAIQGSPYFDVPSAAIRRRPRPMLGDMAAIYASFTSKRNAEDTCAPERKRIKVEENNDLVATTEKPDTLD